MNKPRILLVGAFPPPDSNIFGGVLTSCRTLIESSFTTRFEPVLVDSTQISNPTPPFVRRAILAAQRFGIFCKQLIASRPDAVILFTAVGASIVEKGAMAWLTRLFGVPVLMFPRGAGLIDSAAASRFHRLWIRLAFRGATHFLCQGPTWQRFAIEEMGFAPSHAPIVPNWTATDNLLSIGTRRVARTSGHIVQLLFLGWLEMDKGICELLQACSRLSERYVFRLVIAGRGHAEEAARDYVRRVSLSDRVEFAGWVQGQALEQLLAESDVLVLPSWAEGMPNAMIEAMAAGLAVIVSAVGNVPDVVTDGREALLVPPKRGDALESAIQRLLDDAALRGSIARTGHAFVKREYAVEPAVEVLAKAIESAIEASRPRLSRVNR